MHDQTVNAEIAELARDLKQYIKENRSAVDTLDGLSTRWQVATGRCLDPKKIRLALEQLCEQGWLSKRRMQGGKVLYVPDLSKD